MPTVTAHPAEVLRAFHATRRDRIAIDTATWSRSLDRWGADSLRGIEAEPAHDAASEAHVRHEQMCRASAINMRPWLPGSIRLWFAATAANRVAEIAVDAANATGLLAELNGRLDAIRAREGLTADEDWGEGDETAPAHYRECIAEYDVLRRQVYDDAFLSVLRRYRLRAVGRLYRDDRGRYDELFECGRERLFGRG